MGWCYALVNNRLAELFFESRKGKEPKIRGYCLVKREEYKTKTEQRWIDWDTAKFRFSYRRGKFRRLM